MRRRVEQWVANPGPPPEALAALIRQVHVQDLLELTALRGQLSGNEMRREADDLFGDLMQIADDDERMLQRFRWEYIMRQTDVRTEFSGAVLTWLGRLVSEWLDQVLDDWLQQMINGRGPE